MPNESGSRTYDELVRHELSELARGEHKTEEAINLLAHLCLDLLNRIEELERVARSGKERAGSL